MEPERRFGMTREELETFMEDLVREGILKRFANGAYQVTPEGWGKLGAMTRNTCPKCSSRNVVRRPVLDETLASAGGHDYEPMPDLWIHYRCCDTCRVVWTAHASWGDDLGVLDSERNHEQLLNGHYEVLDF